MKFHITGTRRGLGKALEEQFGNCGSLEECDIFINCKHDGFQQTELLYKAVRLGKRVINIGSRASYHTSRSKYAVEKKTLREANKHLFDQGANVTCINFGYIDTESQEGKDVPKMTVDYCVEVIEWILFQPYRIKELTVCP